jgi:hypothetical protein
MTVPRRPGSLLLKTGAWNRLPADLVRHSWARAGGDGTVARRIHMLSRSWTRNRTDTAMLRRLCAAIGECLEGLKPDRCSDQITVALALPSEVQSSKSAQRFAPDSF